MLLSIKSNKRIFALLMSLLFMYNGSFNVIYANDLKEASATRVDYYYTGKEEVYTVPYSGTYVIEAYGAFGGDVGLAYGSRGCNINGKIHLDAGDKLYINVGGPGGSGTVGGYNGGGDSNYKYTGSGGGATSISYNSGVITKSGYDPNSLIMVAGGGGGGSDFGIFSDGGGDGVTPESDANIEDFSPQGQDDDMDEISSISCYYGAGGGGFEGGSRGSKSHIGGYGGSSYISSSVTNSDSWIGGSTEARARIHLYRKDPEVSLSGHLNNQWKNPAEDITVDYNGNSVTTDADGDFTLTSPPTPSSSSLTISDEDYNTYTVELSLSSDKDLGEIDISKTNYLQRFNLYSKDGELIGTYTKEVPTS